MFDKSLDQCGELFCTGWCEHKNGSYADFFRIVTNCRSMIS